MADKKVALEVEITTKGGTEKVSQTVKSIKTELREAKEEAIAMSRKFGELSPEATKAAAKFANLKDEMEDLNQKVQGLNPDKFARMATLTNGVVRGFQAAQGAAVLFGNTSEDIEKTIAKLQATMALADGIQGVLDAKKGFIDLGNQIKGNVVKAFTTLKGAVAATGIGLLVVGIGALVANWKEFSAAVLKSFPILKQVGEFFSNIKQVASGAIDGIIAGFKSIGEIATKLFSGDFSGAYDAAKKFGTKVAEGYNKGYAEKDQELKEDYAIKAKRKEIELLEAQGKDVTNAKISLLKRERAILDKDSDEYFQKTLEIEKLRTDRRDKLTKEKEDRKKAELEAAAKAEQETYDRYKREHEAQIKKEEEEERIREENIKYRQEGQAQFNKELEEEAAFQKDIADKVAADKKAALDKELEDLKAVEQAKQEVRMAALDNLASIGQSIVALAGKNKQMAKIGLAIEEAVGIAKIVINTQVAAAKANATYPPPFGQIAAGVAIASGALSIAASVKATATAMKQLGGGSSGGGGTPMEAPRGISVPQTGFTTLRTPQTTQKGNEFPVQKVVILQKDITDAAKVAVQIESKAVVK